MNFKPLFIATFIAAAGGYAFAEDAHHPDEPKDVAVEPPAKRASKGEVGLDNYMKRMHEHMAAIRAASDPKERQRLMEEHMKSMLEAMSMMQCMMTSAGK